LKKSAFVLYIYIVQLCFPISHTTSLDGDCSCRTVFPSTIQSPHLFR